MSATSIYTRLFEFYDYEGKEFDYDVFETRIAFIDIKIKMHYLTVSITITVDTSIVYSGHIDKAPDLNPYNMLLEYDKKISKRPINSLVGEVKKAFSRGYNLTSFLESNVRDVLRFTERVYSGNDTTQLYNYYIEFCKYKENIRAEMNCTTLFLDNAGQITNSQKQSYQCSLSSIEVLKIMQHSEIFEVLIEQAAGSNVATMNHLRPYLRKCAIDEILRTL